MESRSSTFFGGETDDCQISPVVQQSEGGGLARRGSTGLEDFQPYAPAPGLLDEGAHGGLQLFLLLGTGNQSQRSAVLGGQFKPGWIGINGYDCGAYGRRNLHAESTHTSHADKHSYVIRCQAGAANRFERGGHGIGYHRQQIEADA